MLCMSLTRDEAFQVLGGTHEGYNGPNGRSLCVSFIERSLDISMFQKGEMQIAESCV